MSIVAGGSAGGLSGVKSIGTVAKIDVTDIGTGVVSHTLTAGKSAIYFQNQGTKFVWWGDANVDPANNRGTYLTPVAGFSYSNCAPGFTVYFACPSGDTSTIGITEG